VTRVTREKSLIYARLCNELGQFLLI